MIAAENANAKINKFMSRFDKKKNKLFKSSSTEVNLNQKAQNQIIEANK